MAKQYGKYTAISAVIILVYFAIFLIPEPNSSARPISLKKPAIFGAAGCNGVFRAPGGECHGGHCPADPAVQAAPAPVGPECTGQLRNPGQCG